MTFYVFYQIGFAENQILQEQDQFRSKTNIHGKYHMLHRIPKFYVKYQCGFLKYTMVFQNTSKIQIFLECSLKGI